MKVWNAFVYSITNICFSFSFFYRVFTPLTAITMEPSSSASRGMGRGRRKLRSPSPRRDEGRERQRERDASAERAAIVAKQHQSRQQDSSSSPPTVRSESSSSTGGRELLPEQLKKLRVSEQDIESTRGSRRGARVEQSCDIVNTRPDDLHCKTGKSGRELTLLTNYFPVRKLNEGWQLYQYRVDFSPEEDNERTRKSIVRGHKDELGGAYIFDGMTLFTVKSLGDGAASIVFKGTRKDTGEEIETKLRYVGNPQDGSIIYIQVYNLLLRKCLFAMKLEEMGRHFYDPEAAIQIPKERLELWPGMFLIMISFISMYVCVSFVKMQ